MTQNVINHNTRIYCTFKVIYGDDQNFGSDNNQKCHDLTVWRLRSSIKFGVVFRFCLNLLDFRTDILFLGQ